MESKLTKAERIVIDKLGEAFNLFLQLPIQHPMHQQEMANKIHDAQRIVMARVVERQEGTIHSPEGNHFRLRVDGNSYVWSQPSICKNDILRLAGETDYSNHYVLWLLGTSRIEIKHDEPIMLHPGSENIFVAIYTGPTTGG